MSDLAYLDQLPTDGFDVPERIVCAANKYGEMVIAGVRHGCDTMCDGLETAIVLGKIKAQVKRWDDESQMSYYREGHSCSDAVSVLEDIIKDADIETKFERPKEIQGFLTSKYRFVNRQEAWVIAAEQRQIVRRVGGDTSNGGTLYSENLY